MEQTHDYEIACERYLLGQLSEQERTQLEENYFEDDALFERFLAVKDDLVDAYARGELLADKRERFEQYFLATDPRRQRVEDARQFVSAITSVSEAPTREASQDAKTRKASWWRSISETVSERIGLPPLVFQGALAVLLLVSLAGAWVWVRNVQSRQAERARLQSEEAERREGVEGQSSNSSNARVPDVVNDKTANLGNQPANSMASPTSGTINRPPPRTMPAQVASLTLLPFAARDSSSSNSLLLSSDTRAVRLRLTFKGDDYRSYDVILRTLEGDQIMHRRGLKAASSSLGKSLTLTLDPSLLRRQDYIMTLNGLTKDSQSEAIAEYYFRVERSASQSVPEPHHQ